jgi:putative SOS response-associated peptidase YedK
MSCRGALPADDASIAPRQEGTAVCGRFTLVASGDDLFQHFGLSEAPAAVERYNVAPGQPVLSIGPSRQGKPAPALFRWGLVPSWASDPTKATINARAESAMSKPTFSEAMCKRRCLVPATGFYEWEVLPGRKKRPWHFRLKGGGLFAFAGLWESWRPPAGPVLLTCAFLTTAANETVKPVHGRMPLILSPESYGTWIDRGREDVADLLRPFPAERMEAFPVGPFVNDARHEGPECLTAPA